MSALGGTLLCLFGAQAVDRFETGAGGQYSGGAYNRVKLPSGLESAA